MRCCARATLPRGHGATCRHRRRGQAVRRYADLLREHKDALGTLVTLENGKIKAEGDGEVQEMIDIADFAVGQSRMLYGMTLHSERPSHRMYEQWHPLGVVGVITAFNFPVAVWAWNAMLACVCGNAVVWKPSPKTPLCALAASHLANRVDRRTWTCRRSSRWRSAATSSARRSPTTRASRWCRSPARRGSARRSPSTVSARFGKVLLECGGNNAVIVADDADLDLVVPAVVFGAVGTAGPALHDHAAPDRASIARSTTCSRGLPPRIAQVRIGDPLEPATLMGPLIDRAAVDAVHAGGRRGARSRRDDRARRRTHRWQPDSSSSRRSSPASTTRARSCSARRSRRCST